MVKSECSHRLQPVQGFVWMNRWPHVLFYLKLYMQQYHNLDSLMLQCLTVEVKQLCLDKGYEMSKNNSLEV